eukprot:TRINITY_DN92_c0_g1_i1.p1 TRINITY_DN92_c0_g1~~TRINITY_DN92_c0_g1_i1.p1  ORF type:complete len:648 (+),score=80.37 TRINITY_DN92_c0_g1_i1:113-2056(+)
MSEIELKLTIIRVNGSQEMRRVRLVSPSFEALCNVVKKWVRGIYSIEYVDDEGDYITVETEEEWEECIDIWKTGGSGTLKLRVNNNINHEVCERKSVFAINDENIDGNKHHFHGMRCLPFFSSGRKRSCCPKNTRNPNAHGKRCTNFTEPPLVIEGKCTNCTYSATGITEGYCCNRCRNGKGAHGPHCRRIIHSEGRVDKESFEREAKHCCRRNLNHPELHGRRCVNYTEPPLVIEGKCTNCTYSATGITEGYCCNRCRNGKGAHGPHCRRIIHSEGRVDKESFEREAKHCCRRNLNHPELHGRRCVNYTEPPLVIEGKCRNCTYSATGITEGFCCNRCRHGKGVHGPHCRRIIHSEGRADSESFEREAKHCCRRNLHHPGLHGRRCTNFTEPPLVIEGECTNCNYSATGITEGYCCNRCRNGKGGHGPRCRRIVHSEGRVDEQAFERESQHCCRRNFYHPGFHTRRCDIVTPGQHAQGMDRPFCCKKNARFPDYHNRNCHNITRCEPTAVKGKCGNCSYAITGVVDGFCCRACLHHPGTHGPRCKRITHIVAKEEQEAVSDVLQNPADQSTVSITEASPIEKEVSKVCESEPVVEGIVVKEEVAPEPYSQEINLIASMGFPITDDIRQRLLQSNGDVQQVISHLLS